MEERLNLSPKRVIVAILWTIGLIIFEVNTIAFFKGYYDATWKVAVAIIVGTIAYMYISMFGIAGIYLFICGLINKESKKEYINAGLCLAATATVLTMAMYLHFRESSAGMCVLIAAIITAIITAVSFVRCFRFE